MRHKDEVVTVKYLIESREIEHNILGRFDNFLDNFSDFLISLDISPGYSWYLIEIQMNQLIPSMAGDVDILAGRLEAADPKQFEELLEKWNKKSPDAHPSRNYRLAAIDLAWKGGLKWMPSLDYLVGIEVKCCYLPPTASEFAEDEMKSTKSSPEAIKGIRQQVDKLSKIGFDKVGLFEFVANPPADGIGNQPWNIASRICGGSIDAMRIIFEKRLPEASFAGHGACSVSGVFGREEHHSGVYENVILRQAHNNPLLSEKEEVKANRQELEENLARILQGLSNPRNTPAIFVCDKGTHQIHSANEGIFRC